MTARRRVAVLCSGRGSNLGALLSACADPSAPGEIVRVISNRPGAGCLERATAAGVAGETVDHTAYPDRPAFEAALHARLQEAGAELVCLAGFMRVLTPGFVGRWLGRMINIHPSLLPLFPGLDTHARALAAGVAVHGCTVHFVTDGVDEGPIIGQAAVAVQARDDADALAARVLAQEHRLYPACLTAVASGAVRYEAGRATGPRVALFDAPAAAPDAARA